MRTSRRTLLTALVTLLVHAVLLTAKVYAHPSRSLLSVFHVGGAQTYHPEFIVQEGYPVDPYGYGTDGQQYLYVAHDPLALGGEMARSIDAPRYRYGRVLLPALAWLICLGDSPCIPRAIIATNLVFATGIGAITAVLVAEIGASGWWALVLGCSGSLACATDLANVEITAQFFGLLGVLWFSRGRVTGAAVAWALAALARESYLLLPIGYAASIVLTVWSSRGHAVEGTVRSEGVRARCIVAISRAAPLLVSCVPWLAWKAYVLARVSPDVLGAASNLSLPFMGIVPHLVSFAHDPQITGSTLITCAVAIPLLVVIARHGLALRQDRSGLAVATFLFTLMGVVGSPVVWFRAGGFARALDFVYPGAVLSALKRGDRTTALLGATTLVQTVNILLDHLLVPVRL